MTDLVREKEVERLEAIIRIHHSIGAVLDIKEIARILVRELTHLIECEAAAILLIEGSTVEVVAERGFSKTFGGAHFTTEMPAIKHIMATGTTIFANDIANSPAAKCVPSGCAMCSLICAPITVGAEIKGIIHLDSAKQNAFDSDDVEFTEMLAREASVAIERSLLYAQVMDVAIKDGLTGCFNRRKFDLDIVADVAQSRQTNAPLSMLMVDLDFFKKYNDYHGHQQGDEVLKKLVTLMTANVRPTDRVYRYGGEEFAILLPETGKVKALYAAGRLREIIEREEFYGEKESQPNKGVTISIGVATFPIDAMNYTELIKASDIALYEAKNTGRNKVCSFNKLRV